MNIPYRIALKNALYLKKNNPNKFKDLIVQFSQMSSGSDGGFFFTSDRSVKVREHYYPKWENKDFKKLLTEIQNEQ